ncbi:hypothetical protein [Arsenophonus nasoniae]|uniref:Uncharacterized protein n=1 Tax=Arsenophonus nasoniae TaxID=638 RepID=A0AA95GJB5_9GAMM|nr:hypothetical protein [Arsenophonus nasoniae]WGL99996.1 hypothetical protein QE210_08755 [Arsenophonus nasoniae]
MLNRKFLLYLCFFLIPACTPKYDQADERSNNNELAKCDIISYNSKLERLTGKDFALKMFLAADTVQTKRKTYHLLDATLKQRLGYGMVNPKDFQNISNKIAECFYTNRKIITSDIPEYFEKMKELTKNIKQKEALIKAYSAWDVYVDQPPHIDDIEKKTRFETALAFYKNIL